MAPGTAIAAPTPSTPALPGGASSAALGVTATPDGWIHYSHTLGSYLTDAKTTLIQGSVGSDGQCVFSSTSGVAAVGSAGYSEQTGFNPVTCQSSVVSGQLTAAGQAQLQADGPTAGAGAATAGAQSTSAGTTMPAPAAPHARVDGAATAVTPAAAGSWAAFEKVSYVDPLDITITSLVDNLSWSGNGVPASSNGKITGGSA